MHRAVIHRRQDPIPAYGIEGRTHILTTLFLGLGLIPHAPGTGPNPHYLSYSTTTRTRRLMTTSIAAARSIPGMCVYKHLDMAPDRVQGAQARLGSLCQ